MDCRTRGRSDSREFGEVEDYSSKLSPPATSLLQKMVKLGFFILRVAAGGAGHMVFPILGPYVSPLVHNSVLENIISLGRV